MKNLITTTLLLLALLLPASAAAFDFNNKKSTNGSSSRKEHNFVIHVLKDTLKFHKNNPIIAITITKDDFHNIDEKKNRYLLQFASIIGKKNKQKVKITR